MRKKTVKKSVKKIIQKRKPRPVVGKHKTGNSVFPDAPIPKSKKNRGKGEEAEAVSHRLQKVLAAAGYGSRRACEELITSGRVDVDRRTVTLLGTRVNPIIQEIRVDGQMMPKNKPTYIALFKPKGYLCTNRDQKGRKRVIDLIPASFGRLFPVGRLDLNSEGLLVLTNDGALADRLTHPRYGVPKVYRVQVAGTVERNTIELLKKGIYLAEGFVRAEEVIIKKHHKQSTFLEITLREGKNREIRRMLAHVHHKVLALLRYSVGPIKIGKMLPGDFRVLTAREVSSLYAVAEKEQTE